MTTIFKAETMGHKFTVDAQGAIFLVEREDERGAITYSMGFDNPADAVNIAMHQLQEWITSDEELGL